MRERLSDLSIGVGIVEHIHLKGHILKKIEVLVKLLLINFLHDCNSETAMKQEEHITYFAH